MPSRRLAASFISSLDKPSKPTVGLSHDPDCGWVMLVTVILLHSDNSIFSQRCHDVLIVLCASDCESALYPAAGSALLSRILAIHSNYLER
jgi:hypothetical protein